MHPEITREMVRAQQADLSRQSARRSALIGSAGPAGPAERDDSRRSSRRRRPFRAGLRVARRQAARVSPRAH